MRRYPFIPLLALVLAAAGGKHALDAKFAERGETTIRLKPVQAAYHGESLKRTSFGFDLLVSDLLWIKLLQSASHKPLRPGEVSWEYAQVAAINRLDPNFHRAYDFGTIFLSVFRRDRLGAELVLRRWVREQPNRWKPRWLLGYHLYFEMGRYEEASAYILQAAAMPGAPPHLTALGIRLLSEAGSLAQALQISLQLYDNLSDLEAKYRLRKRVRSLCYALTLSSWKEALAKFRAANRREPGDISELSPLAQGSQRELSSLLDVAEVSGELAPLLEEKFEFRFDPATKRVLPLQPPEALGIDPVGLHQPPEAM